MEKDQFNFKTENGYKKKLREIAQKQERSMTSQFKVMVDDFYERVAEE